MRWAFALLALAAVARADGKFMSTQVPVVEIPDQQAILVFKDGRERLVIDTAYAGEGDLAWIVPLPAPPKIEPVSPAVFRTIEVVTAPDVVSRPPETWWMGLYLLVAITIVSLIPSRRFIIRAVAMFALFLGLALILLMIPRSQSGGDDVTVLSRGQTGSYETATLQSIDAGALLSWLGENGFQVAPKARTGIEEYVRDGWILAVARLKSGGHGGRAHPLSFEFAAKEPVYPMRLTGAQGRALSLRLFVLADRRARCDGLPVESCYQTGAAEYPRGYGRDEDEIRLIGQPELLRIAGSATVLTTLRGELEPTQMRRDLRIGFEDYAPVVPVLYSEEAARSGAAGTAAWIALALLLPCYLAVGRIRERGKGWRHAFHSWVRVGRRGMIVTWCVAIDLGLLAGAAGYIMTDTVEMRGGESGGALKFVLLHGRARALVKAEATDSIETARAVATRVWQGQRNLYDGLPVREEASPGNYGFEMRDGKVAYVRYDSRGMNASANDEW